MRHSIRARLLVWMLALLVPLSVGAGWLLIQVFGNRLLHDIDVALLEEAETITELLGTSADASAITDLLNRIAGELEPGPQKFVTVMRGEQLVAAVPRNAQTVIASGDPQLRVVRYASRDRSVSVSIAVSVATALHAKQRLTSLLAVGLPLLLACCGAGVWLVTGRALRPLADASRRLEAIAADNLAVRVPVDNPHDEVGRMVSVLNRMLDRLQSAVETLQRFTGEAAHELRTPLTVLRTGLEVAQSRQRSAAEYRAALGEALASTERLCRLADDLLTLARLEAAAGLRHAAPVDVNEMLHELAAAWRTDASEDVAAGGTVDIRIAPAPAAWVLGNAGDLYRLFNNLIDNAVHHGRDAAARAEVLLSTRRLGDRIEAAVADGGAGIATDDVPRVFDRFHRGNGAAAPGGTGLGLSIAQEIARAHGGAIRAENRDGGGCVFRVTLPAA